MKDTVKALEEKVVLFEAKLGKKSESKAGVSGSSPTTSPRKPPLIQRKNFSVTSGKSWVFWIQKFKVLQPLPSGVLSFSVKYYPCI